MAMRVGPSAGATVDGKPQSLSHLRLVPPLTVDD